MGPFDDIETLAMSVALASSPLSDDSSPPWPVMTFVSLPLWPVMMGWQYTRRRFAATVSYRYGLINSLFFRLLVDSPP